MLQPSGWRLSFEPCMTWTHLLVSLVCQHCLFVFFFLSTAVNHYLLTALNSGSALTFFFFRKYLRNSLNCLEFTIVDLLYSRYTVDLLFWMWLSQNVATFTAKSLSFGSEGWPSFRSLFLGPENWYHNLGKDYSTSDGIKAKNSCSPNHIRMALLPFDYYQLEKQGFVDF